MQRVVIQPTRTTPYVLLDPDENLICFKGISLPEDAIGFFTPVVKWIKEYGSDREKVNEKNTLRVLFNLSYYNSATHRAFLEMFHLFREMMEKGMSVTIEWFYEKDDYIMLENGRELEELVKIPLQYSEM